jgi:hypothetical protein
MTEGESLAVEETLMENGNPQPEISERKIEANRSNAQRSTGPRTAEGKRTSSRNAMKHGILAREVVVRRGKRRENPRAFQELLTELIEDRQPEGRTEMSLVETVAICDWRFRRTLRAEAEDVANDFNMSLPTDRALPDMTQILRYQTTIHRQKMQALQLLEKLQQRRRNPLPASADTESGAEEK